MFNRLFSRRPTPGEIAAPVDYESLFNEVMEGLAAGWTAGQVKAYLTGRENDQQFVEWLFRYDREVLQVEPEQYHQIAEQLVQWGDMEGGLVGQMVKEIGQQKQKRPEIVPSVLDQQVETLFTQGSSAYVEGDLLGAIAAYNQALAIKPDNHEVLYEKGRVLADIGRREEAVKIYRKSLDIQKTSSALSSLGVCLNNLGRYEEAIDCADGALKLNPKEAHALYIEGFALNRLGKYVEAIEACDEALTFDANNCLVLSEKGDALAYLGRHEEAISIFDRILSLQLDERVLNNKGISLINLERYEEAILSFGTAATIRPDKHEALHNRGGLLLKIGQYEDAIATFNAVLTIKPSFHQALGNKGLALARLGQYEEAITTFDHALSIKPRFPAAIGNK